MPALDGQVALMAVGGSGSGRGIAGEARACRSAAKVSSSEIRSCNPGPGSRDYSALEIPTTKLASMPI